MLKLISDPDLYNQLNQPFASKKEAESALDIFLTEVRELRIKYKIPDVTIIARVITDDNIDLMQSHHNGNLLLKLPMLLAATEQEIQLSDVTEQKDETVTVPPPKPRICLGPACKRLLDPIAERCWYCGRRTMPAEE